MRLNREVGTLNREIVAIREKWKIALNINSKKVAIEKLITMKKLNDSHHMDELIEKASQRELIEFQRQEIEEREYHNDNRDELDNDFEEAVVIEKKETSPEIDTTIEKEQEEKIATRQNRILSEYRNRRKEEENPHLTVSWLKNRMKKG
jgi:hypothetical protein